jgi:methionyl-tRNA synthetase
MAKKPFYITTTLPYVNSDPHIGFAMEIIRADVIARAKKLEGYDVFFNTGTDEHGVKIYQKAFNAGESTQAFVDRYVTKFQELKSVLGLSDDIHFIRTTDTHHVAAAQEFWRRCDKNGFVYKKLYKTKYCSGCELEKTDTELNEDGRCFIHPTLDLLLIDEENYFFKFSAFQQQLLDLYKNNPILVVPDFRFNEIKAFVARGLEDFSISRLKTKMPWGVPVPDDADHVMYVWFDALTSYISTLGWPEDTKNFETFWKHGTPVQYCGKDNLRQQSAMWQAMLMSVNLPSTHTIVIDGFVTGDGGVKMSKSLGNTVDPLDIVTEYGVDALRYYVCRELSPFEDSPFTMEKFKEAYNAHLANGVGNLTSRVMKMATTNLAAAPELPEKTIPEEFFKALSAFNIQAASNIVWEHISAADRIIQEKEPFKLVKTDKEQALEIIKDLCVRLYTIGRMLNPIMPNTSEIIKKLVKENKMPDAPLFVRK